MKRLFLACTPRTGNLWFRRMLAGCLDIPEAAAHSPAEIDWDALPPDCLVAMHWRHTPALAQFLRGFDTLVTIRHPLDVLLSILQFAPHEPATGRWLNGEAGNEASLIGVKPTDRKFLEYGLSKRAEVLLGISAEWMGNARSRVRYEDLVQSTRRTLERVLEDLNEAPAGDIDVVIGANSMENLRRFSAYHFWQGRPGLWRDLIVKEYRDAIYARDRELFQTYGYDIEDVSAPPDVSEADAYWNQLISR